MSCAICLEDISNNRYILSECSHQFHRKCIMNWFLQKTNCPLCRKHNEYSISIAYNNQISIQKYRELRQKYNNDKNNKKSVTHKQFEALKKLKKELKELKKIKLEEITTYNSLKKRKRQLYRRIEHKKLQIGYSFSDLL